MSGVLSAVVLAIVGARPATAGATRADLARSYLRFEQALARHPEVLARDARRLNERFDRASLAFFTGAFATSCRELDQMGLELEGAADDPALRFARSLRLEGLAPVTVVGAGAPASASPLTLSPLWNDSELATPATPSAAVSGALRLELLRVEERQLPAAVPSAPTWSEELAFAADGRASATIAWSTLALRPGRHVVALRLPDGRLEALAATTVVRASLDRGRAALLAELATIATPTPALRSARAIARARAGLVTDSPSPLSSAQFLIEPLALLREVKEEVAALREGRDPYAGRVGDLWRVLEVDGGLVPLRTFVPTACCDVDAPPSPVVIALHGAGGDENMFMDGYGAGLLRRLAEARQFIAVSPQTNAFAADPANFERLLDDLASRHSIDRARIYVVGHSMGAAAAATLARTHATALAGVACLAGGSFGSGALARTLVVVGGIDPIVPPGGVLRSARAAIGAGQPVTIVEHPEFGHTLLVTHALPAVVEWLLDG